MRSKSCDEFNMNATTVLLLQCTDSHAPNVEECAYYYIPMPNEKCPSVLALGDGSWHVLPNQLNDIPCTALSARTRPTAGAAPLGLCARLHEVRRSHRRRLDSRKFPRVELLGETADHAAKAAIRNESLAL